MPTVASGERLIAKPQEAVLRLSHCKTKVKPGKREKYTFAFTKQYWGISTPHRGIAGWICNARAANTPPPRKFCQTLPWAQQTFRVVLTKKLDWSTYAALTLWDLGSHSAWLNLMSQMVSSMTSLHHYCPRLHSILLFPKGMHTVGYLSPATGAVKHKLWGRVEDMVRCIPRQHSF